HGQRYHRQGRGGLLAPMATLEQPTAGRSETASVIQPRIDADIHNVVPRVEALFPYLDQHWVETVTQTLFKGAVDPTYPPRAPTSALPESKPEDGPPGSSLEMLRQQVLDKDQIELGILTCAYAIDSLRNPDAAIAFASAV